MSGTLTVFKFAILAVSLLTSFEASATSNLMITTPRVVLEGRSRTDSINLKNRGDSTGRYQIFFREKQMTSSGNIVDSKARANQWSAARLVRFSPSRLKLGAQQSQRIRLAVRKPADLAEGEYRSHLVFRSRALAPEQNQNNGRAGVNFSPTFEFSIPIIVRHGRTWAEARLSDGSVVYQAHQQQIRLTLQRQGNRSLYGDFHVFGLEDDQTAISLFKLKGIAHYTPLPEREVLLAVPKHLSLHSFQRLRVVFEEQPKYGGNQRAELDIEL
ncbi:fimbrial biogenesis chaperone [Marinobacterium arenosum]|uniref:fimbrial biogenesis chaperone n=1 Tax=Marinobacterium arenosum TaxID=2862496 RepID=UPI001C9715D7|nr:hypothetical protein [Marinobacterium arenosum]MBY4676499.1 hypothetical protein [Marinobacterium arenosum]